MDVRFQALRTTWIVNLVAMSVAALSMKIAGAPDWAMILFAYVALAGASRFDLALDRRMLQESMRMIVYPPSRLDDSP